MKKQLFLFTFIALAAPFLNTSVLKANMLDQIRDGVNYNDPVSQAVVDASGYAAAKSAETSINDKLENVNCYFIDDTTEKEVKCAKTDFDSVVQMIYGWREGLQRTIAYDIEIHVTAHAKEKDLAKKRSHYIGDKLNFKMDWFHTFDKGVKADDNKLEIKLKVNPA
jgi:hypothetical protein